MPKYFVSFVKSFNMIVESDLGYDEFYETMGDRVPDHQIDAYCDEIHEVCDCEEVNEDSEADCTLVVDFDKVELR